MAWEEWEQLKEAAAQRRPSAAHMQLNQSPTSSAPAVEGIGDLKSRKAAWTSAGHDSSLLRDDVSKALGRPENGQHGVGKKAGCLTSGPLLAPLWCRCVNVTAPQHGLGARPVCRGGAEEFAAGTGRAEPRPAVRIATKVRQNPLVAHSWPKSAEGLSARAVRTGVAESLERLGVAHVDLLWAHAEDRTVPLEETVGAFAELVTKGMALRVGAANHAARCVARARSLAREQGAEPWTALQLRHSLVQPRPLTPVAEAGHRMLTADDLDLARSEGLSICSYSSLLWGSYVRADRPLPPTCDHPGTVRVLAALEEVADELAVTRNQVVLAWLMQQGIDPIVGASRVEQIEEALAARRVRLSDGHLTRFAEAP